LAWLDGGHKEKDEERKIMNGRTMKGDEGRKMKEEDARRCR
jgi:hypothetical protein